MLSITKIKGPAQHDVELFNTILSCDPLISDTACQLRVIYLLHLYQAIQAHRISDEALRYIQDCYTLTQVSEKVIDPILEVAISQRTVIPKGMRFYDSAHQEITSKNKKEGLIAGLKAKVASESIEFIRHFQSSKDSFVDYFNKDNALFISSSQQKIPLLPCYINTQLMLRALKEERGLLIVNMKRIIVAADKTKRMNTEMICYRYDRLGFLALSAPPDKTLLSEPAVTIDMYSSIVQSCEENESSIEPLFLENNFSEFIAGFSALDIATIIMMCAAAHDQLPTTAKGATAAVARDFAPGLFLESTKVSEVIFDLDVCSKEQYQRLHQTAITYGLSDSDNFYNPIRIHHIYLSTLERLRAQSTPIATPAMAALLDMGFLRAISVPDTTTQITPGVSPC